MDCISRDGTDPPLPQINASQPSGVGIQHGTDLTGKSLRVVAWKLHCSVHVLADIQDMLFHQWHDFQMDFLKFRSLHTKSKICFGPWSLEKILDLTSAPFSSHRLASWSVKVPVTQTSQPLYYEGLCLVGSFDWHWLFSPDFNVDTFSSSKDPSDFSPAILKVDEVVVFVYNPIQTWNGFGCRKSCTLDFFYMFFLDHWCQCSLFFVPVIRHEFFGPWDSC